MNNNNPFETLHFSQWMDIQNRKIFISISDSDEWIKDIADYSQTSQGKLYVYVFSAGICNEEFNEMYPGMIDDFNLRKVKIHNYCVRENINPHDIIPTCDELRNKLLKPEDIIFIENDLNTQTI